MNGQHVPRHLLSRRRFVQGAGLAGLGLLAGCGSPFARLQAPLVHRIGFVALYPQPYDEAFFQRLQDLGYTENQNLAVERRYGERDDQLSDLTAELVRLRPDILVALGTPAVSAAQRAATYVDRIFKGAKPADLPVEQPREFDFVINLKTAQALGLTIPQHVLLQATEVIQ